jgi:enoyl-CoA hydratase/carnithine racemase
MQTVDLTKQLDGLIYEKRDQIATITLNRPERGNATTPAMSRAFKAIYADIKEDPDVRVAIITGAGERHFCTGADVVAASESGTVARNVPMWEEVFWSPRHNEVWKPVICAVNGLVASAGLHFVVDSDIVVAADHAAFMDTHVNVGMVGAIENIGLAKRLPLGSALRMTLQGRSYRMPAKRAHELGLVDELVPLADLMSTAEGIAREIAKNSPQAVSLSKESIWGSLERSYRDALEYGWALLRLHWSHPDFVEGPRAFVEKRDPKWNPDPSATQ